MKSKNDDAHLAETKVSSEQVFRGELLDVRRDTVRLPDGGETTREYIVHPGAVMIIPRLPDGKLLLERQYRYPHARVFIEFPAGKIDPGEDPLATAKRELAEETGYTATDWTYLAQLHPIVAYCTERIDIFVADGLEHVGAQLDHGEFLETFTAGLDQALEWLDRGEITDSKTMIGLLLLARRAPAIPQR
ncbi:MAG TPA: NUDIX hydrolase [Patescibacteria group bacterium]|nr:NUDIX hydrolase [Casimicrobiaceae bacterium]HYK63928.1 NUDIX hydrolase [Patescibacteria group bacterium]